MKIHVKTWQKCPKCGGAFTYKDDRFFCTTCLTVPEKCYLEWCYQGQPYRRFGYNSFTDAQIDAVQIEAEMRGKRFDVEKYKSGSRVPRKYTVEDAAKTYLEDRKVRVSWDGKDETGLSPSTYKKIVEHINEFVAWCEVAGSTDIRLIKTYEVRKYTRSIEARNSAKTVKNKLANIRKFFSELQQLHGRSVINELPLFEKKTISTKEPEIMDCAERTAAIKAMPAEHQPLFRFMERAGVRPCEATAMKHSHLMFDADIPYWQVQAELIEGGYYRSITKTKNQWSVPLDDTDIVIIKSVPRSLQTEYLFYWIDKRDKGKAKPYRGKMLRRIWSEACEAADVQHVTIYNSFRHTTISKWLDDSMSEDDASALVGHKCRSTIRKYDRSKRIERLMRATKKCPLTFR